MRIAHFSNGGAARFGLVTDDFLGIEVLAGDPLHHGVERTGEVLARECAAPAAGCQSVKDHRYREKLRGSR